ncbi:hypothetical protein GCM10020229_35910 [Kitasatospora albolonga]|uniref:hypothetical protein n=1 Tax=Kitasatospora albolonga TaxID=68173 RepID=UPI0031E7E5D6
MGADLRGGGGQQHRVLGVAVGHLGRVPGLQGGVPLVEEGGYLALGDPAAPVVAGLGDPAVTVPAAATATAAATAILTRAGRPPVVR